MKTAETIMTGQEIRDKVDEKTQCNPRDQYRATVRIEREKGSFLLLGYEEDGPLIGWVHRIFLETKPTGDRPEAPETPTSKEDKNGQIGLFQ